MMMLRYALIFFLGVLTIPYVHSQSTTDITAETTVAQTTAPQQITEETNVSETTTLQFTEQTDVAQTTAEQTAAPQITTVQTTVAQTTAAQTSTGEAVTPPPSPADDGPNLALILGLSLGIGIPVLSLLGGGLIYFCIKYKSNQKVKPSNDTDTSNTTATSAIVDIPMVPTNTAN